MVVWLNSRFSFKQCTSGITVCGIGRWSCIFRSFIHVWRAQNQMMGESNTPNTEITIRDVFSLCFFFVVVVDYVNTVSIWAVELQYNPARMWRLQCSSGSVTTMSWRKVSPFALVRFCCCCQCQPGVNRRQKIVQFCTCGTSLRQSVL